MTIDEKVLQEERDILKKDFDILSENIKKMENDTKGARNNLNAIYGAIQQCDKFLKLTKTEDTKTEMPKEKAAALNLATS